METSTRYKDSILYPKGVLEGNWFGEEQRRKEVNGFTDTTQNFATQYNPTGKYIMPVYPKDNFDRYDTVNSTYGNFFNLNEEKNPRTLALRKQYEVEGFNLDNKMEEEENKKEEIVNDENNEELKNNNQGILNGDIPATFWLTHINSGNMYRSFIKNPNPWAKSSAFTQPIQNTRGAIQFYQNAYNDPPIGKNL